MTIAQMLLRWCDKECGIFITLCTLIWIFGHNPQMNEVSLFRQKILFIQNQTKPLFTVENSQIHGDPGCHLHVTRNQETHNTQRKDASNGQQTIW